MSVPKLTEQDQALLDFVNMKITKENVEEAIGRLTWTNRSAGMSKRSYSLVVLGHFGHEAEAFDEMDQELQKKLHLGNPEQGLKVDDLTSFRHNLESILRRCIEHRQTILSDVLWDMAKEVVRLRDMRRKNPRVRWPKVLDVRPWDSENNQPLSLEQGITYKTGLSEEDVKAVLEVFDTGNRLILDAYRRGQLKLLHAFHLSQYEGDSEIFSETLKALLHPELHAPDKAVILFDGLDDIIPFGVCEELNELISQCRQEFDFKEGKFGRAVVSCGGYEEHTDKDFDLRIQTAPVIANFLYHHAERLGRCEYPGCELFFVGKQKGKTLCDRHSQARAQAKYRATHREELKQKAREYREKYPLPLVRRKKKG